MENKLPPNKGDVIETQGTHARAVGWVTGPSHHSLREITKEHVLFSPVTFYCHQGLSLEEDPVASWARENGVDSSAFAMHQYELPLFTGIPAPWDRQLYAVHHEFWPALHLGLAGTCTIAGHLNNIQQVYVTSSRPVMVRDLTASSVAWVEVEVFLTETPSWTTVVYTLSRDPEKKPLVLPSIAAVPRSNDYPAPRSLLEWGLRRSAEIKGRLLDKYGSQVDPPQG